MKHLWHAMLWTRYLNYLIFIEPYDTFIQKIQVFTIYQALCLEQHRQDPCQQEKRSLGRETY